MSQPFGRAGGLVGLVGAIAAGYGLWTWDAPADFLIEGQAQVTAQTQAATDMPPVIDIDALYDDARLSFDTASLPNGLKIIVIEDHRAPVVTHMVWYRVGAADEDAGASGLAHFLEHLMFKGTKTRKAGEFSDIVAAAGGQENAFTSQDYTAYYQKIAKQHLPEMMALEADRMANLAFNPAEVLPERAVVMEERRQRIEIRPDGVFGEELNAALYLNHPYGIPIIGWRHELTGLTPEAALDFYKRHYGPDNAILIVAGDTTIEEVTRLANNTYGKLQSMNIPPRQRPQEPQQTVSRRLSFSDPRLPQDRLQINWLVPSYTAQQTDDGPDPYALALLSDIFGSGTTSRLYQRLVVEEKRAPGAGAWYQGMAVDMAEFGVAVTALPGQSLEEIEASARAALQDIADNGVTAEELQRAKLNSLVDQIYAKDSASHLARIIGAGLTVGLDEDSLRNWPDRLRAVTQEQVQQAAKALVAQPSVTGYAVKADPS